MKKYLLHFVQSSFATVILLTISNSAFAQASDPSNWNSFVYSSANTLVSDTFRLQTFGKSAWDNWIYTLSGDASIVSDKYTMKIPVGNNVSFSSYSIPFYSDVKISLHIGALNLVKGESLLFTFFRNGKTETATAFTPEDKDFLSYNTYTIGNNPTDLQIKTMQSSNSKTGYYMSDSLYAYGNIPKYSLFTGSGSWNDTLRWSHLPAMRHRNALINGKVSISSDIHCNDIAINSQGAIQVMPGSSLTLNNLDLYNTDLSILSEGNLSINGRITLHKTFDKTGKWYFIAFPFDVYPTDLDPHFKQKDATPNDGGNFLYIQTYNGDKRALSNQVSGNWEVLPIQPDNTPLFKKNKGYLIALDERATTRTLTFSSQSGEMNNNFTQETSIPVTLKTDLNPTFTEHYGWYL